MTDTTWLNFEDEVFKIVSTMAREGDLSANPDRVRLRRKPKYYSAPRNADIEFELSLEVFDEGASEPSRIWVWECKDKSKSGRKVPVSDIEALKGKLDQLGAGRFSASLVTTNGFQSAAYHLAVTCGISLFTLQKKLVRVTQFSRTQPEGMMVVPTVCEGLSLGGLVLEERDLDDAIVMCLGEMEGTEGEDGQGR